MCQKFLKLLKYICVRIALLVLSFGLVVSLLLGIIFGSPIYFYRYLVKLAAQVFNKELGKMVTTRGAPLAVDDMQGVPTSNVCLSLYLSPIDPEKTSRIFDINIMMRRAIERVVNHKDSEGNLQYPEGQQFITQWGLFSFWQWDREFSAANHFRTYPTVEKFIGEKELLKYEAELIEAPWHKKHSPWEGVLFPNYVNDKGEHQSVIYCRFHHALADGYSIFKMTMQLFGDSEEYMPMVKTPAVNPKTISNTDNKEKVSKIDQNSSKSSMEIFKLALKVPYEFAKHVLIYCDWKNSLHPPVGQMTRRVHLGSSSPIPISLIKEIKTNLKVNFNAVLLAALTGAMRKWMLRKSEKNSIKEKYIHCGIPLPSTNHPAKLRNFITGGVIRLPIGIQDPIERLHKIEKSIEKLRRSSFPAAAFLLMKMPGGLFAPFIKKGLEMSNNSFITIAASFFPSSVSRFQFDGYEVVDCKYTGGLFRGNLGVLITFMSYGDNIRISGVCDTCLKDEGYDMNTIVGYLTDEINILKDLSIV